MNIAKDDRVLLSLLEQVAQLTSPKAKAEFRVGGYPDAEVARHLLILRDLGWIHYIPAGDGEDADDMFVKSPTGAGWNWMTEMRQRPRSPILNWLARHWQWAIGTLIAAAAVAVAVAALVTS